MSQAAPVPVDLLPPLLQRFVELIGLPATLTLVRRLGGLRIYIPRPERVTPEHPLALLIGADKLRALAEDFGGQEHFQLPRAERAMKAVRNAEIARESSAKSARELAAEYALTEGQIVRILAAQRARDRAVDNLHSRPVDKSQLRLL